MTATWLEVVNRQGTQLHEMMNGIRKDHPDDADLRVRRALCAICEPERRRAETRGSRQKIAGAALRSSMRITDHPNGKLDHHVTRTGSHYLARILTCAFRIRRIQRVQREMRA